MQLFNYPAVVPSYVSNVVSIIHASRTTDDENVPPSTRVLCVYVGRTFCGEFAGRDDATYKRGPTLIIISYI